MLFGFTKSSLGLSLHLIIIIAFVGCLYPVPVQAQTPNPESLAEAKAISTMADAALTEFTIGPNATGHKALLDKALAIAIFPNLRRKSFYIRSRTSGSGLVSRRTREGWSAPAFYTIKQGRWVFEFGTSRDDLIILFLNREAINQLSKREVQLGDEASKEMIPYSERYGFNAGGKLRGAVLRPNDTLTAAVTGGMDRLAVLFTQSNATYEIAEKNGTSSTTNKLRSISQVVPTETDVIANVRTENKKTAYDVYFHIAEPKTVTDPLTDGFVAGGVIKADPPVEQWTPKATIIPDDNADWYQVRLPQGGAYYHVVCIETKKGYKELLLQKRCYDQCDITCLNVGASQATTQPETPKQPKDKSSKKPPKK